jgi:DNA-binding CsgD family transcriptional regulator
MIENKNLPMPLKYCKQVVMEFRFENPKTKKLEKFYYFPELNSWMNRVKRVEDRLRYRNMSLNEWRTKWYLGMSIEQTDTIEWATKFVETFYSEKLPNTKKYIVQELLKDMNYSCDFLCVKEDLIFMYYKTRKDNSITIKNYDWSLVPKKIKTVNEYFTVISNEINPKTGSLRGNASTCYNRLITELRDISDSPVSIEEKLQGFARTFFKKATKKYNGKFDYSESEYINNDTPIKIICSNCGNVFFQSPKNHLYSCLCDNCEKPTPKYKIADWDKERDNLKNYLLSGKTYEDIGNIYGCTGHQIKEISRKFGLDTIKDQLREEERNKYIKLLEDGKSIGDIAKIYKVSGAAVSAKLKTLKIDTSKYKFPYVSYLKYSSEIEKMLFDGKSVKFISDKLGTTREIIDHVMQVKGINKDIIKEKLDFNLSEKIRELALKGYCASAIMEVLGISYQVSRRLIKKYKIKITGSISLGEYYVSVFLDNNKSLFKSISMYEKHRDVISSIIYVDFEIIDNGGKTIIIEYNGDQHYRFVKKYHKTKEKFLKRVERDRKLREYCIKNNILYIEIPFMYNTQEKVNDFLNKVLINGVDPNTLVDYNSLYKL